MFGDIFGNVQKQQEELQKTLATIVVEEEVGDGAVTVKASGDQMLVNIKIDPSKIEMSDKEQLEDMILEAANRALSSARDKAAVESEKLMKNMFPMGDLDQFMKGLK